MRLGKRDEINSSPTIGLQEFGMRIFADGVIHIGLRHRWINARNREQDYARLSPLMAREMGFGVNPGVPPIG